MRPSHDEASTTSWWGSCTQFFCLRLPANRRQNKNMCGVCYSSLCLIGERERANLVVHSSGIFYIYIYKFIYIRPPSCKCACAALYALLFIRKYFQIFYTFSHTVPRADRSSQLENSPPFDGMRCNLRWLTKAVPLPNLHGSKVQLPNTPRISRARTAACQLPGGPRLMANPRANPKLGRSRSPRMFNISTSYLLQCWFV